MNRNSLRYAVYLFGYLLLSLTLGCSDGTVKVSGNVTYDGIAIEKGIITFSANDGGSSWDSTIENGKYTARLMPGEMTVKITAFKIVPAEKNVEALPGSGIMRTEEKIQYIPTCYNDKSTLSVSIGNANQNEDFDLKKAPMGEKR
ncbi:MAG: hypothetical protein Q4G68_12030 [Planctomycetia bacterium]|nr:hypothetical protein [Planctomycetia bacterium]